MLRNLLILAAALSVAATATSASLNEAMAKRNGLDSGFFSRHAEGWFWYQDPVEEEPDLVPEPLPVMPPPAPSEPKETEPPLKPFTIAWVRQALDKYKEAAWNDPTPENVKAYFLLQRFVIDRSNKFADVAQQVTVGNALLDETLRRPLANFVTYDVDKAAFAATNELLKKISQHTGLFFFFKSSCPYCEAQAPLLKHIEKLGFKVIAVSIDGGSLKSAQFEDTRQDSGQAQALKVRSTPTIFLMDEKGTFETLAISAVSLPELKERILLSALRTGLITEDEFKKTQPLTNQPAETDLSNRLPELLKASAENPAALWGEDADMKRMNELASADLNGIVDKDGMIPPEMLLALLGDDAQTSRRLSTPEQEEVSPKRRTNEMTVFTEQ